MVVKTRVQRACTRDIYDWYSLNYSVRYGSSGHLTLPIPVLNYEATNHVKFLKADQTKTSTLWASPQRTTEERAHFHISSGTRNRDFNILAVQDSTCVRQHGADPNTFSAQDI
jgi:hypothetical protein